MQLSVVSLFFSLPLSLTKRERERDFVSSLPSSLPGETFVPNQSALQKMPLLNPYAFIAINTLTFSSLMSGNVI